MKINGKTVKCSRCGRGKAYFNNHNHQLCIKCHDDWNEYFKAEKISEKIDKELHDDSSTNPARPRLAYKYFMEWFEYRVKVELT